MIDKWLITLTPCSYVYYSSIFTIWYYRCSRALHEIKKLRKRMIKVHEEYFSKVRWSCSKTEISLVTYTVLYLHMHSTYIIYQDGECAVHVTWAFRQLSFSEKEPMLQRLKVFYWPLILVFSKKEHVRKLGLQNWNRACSVGLNDSNQIAGRECCKPFHEYFNKALWTSYLPKCF